MNNKINLLARGLVILGLCFCSGLYADEYHYNNSLIGDRASGMGGAYTAISDDPSGLFYNPAGIIYGGKKNFSASVNAFNYTTTTYQNVLGGGDWTRQSSNLLPNFFGVTQPLWNGIVGFSYAVSDSILEDQDQVFENFGTNALFNINVNNSENEYKVGPSYSISLTDKLSVGATLYGHYRKNDFITNQWVRKADDTWEWSNIYYQKQEVGVEPVVGMMWSPIDKISVGLAFRKTFIVSTDIRQQTTCITSIDPNPGAQCQARTYLTTGVPAVDPANPQDPGYATATTNRDLPYETSVGIAVFPTNRLIISGDFHYYSSPNSYTPAIWNGALGLEYYLSNTWALRSGFYTNNANTPVIDASLTDQNDHVDVYGFAFSLSRFTRTSSITGGFSFAYGSGQAQVVSGSSAIQDVIVQTINLYLSTSYTY